MTRGVKIDWLGGAVWSWRPSAVRAACFAVGLFALSCSSSEMEDSTLNQDQPAGDIIQEAIQAMSELGSYHISVKPAGEQEAATKWEADVEGDRYRVEQAARQDESYSVCIPEVEPPGTPVVEKCETPTPLDQGVTFYEGVWDSSHVFLRLCELPGSNCTDWQQLAAEPLSAPVSGPGLAYLPYFPIASVTIGKDWIIDGVDRVAGTPVQRLNGSYNPIDAQLQSEKRAFGGKAPPAGDLEAIRQSYEEDPVNISVWISEGDHLVRQVELEVPLDHEGSEAITLLIEFSAFNGASIDVPQVR
jgi:hypothetical protein